MSQSVPGRVRAALGSALSDERLRLWWLLGALYLCVSTLTRVVLAGVAISQGQASLSNVPAMMAVGLLFDIVTALDLFALFALYLVAMPGRIYNSRWHRWLLVGTFSLVVFGLIYLGAVEYFFFDEFNSRFNFVAVEYLIYPHEVFVNIWQSYPVARVMLATLALTAAAIWFMRKPLLGERTPAGSRRIRLATLAVLAAAIGLGQATLNVTAGRYSDNRVVNELAMNGVYSFFNAALNSELDYRTYYLSMPDDEADQRLRKMMTTRHSTFFSETDHIERHVVGNGPPQHLNVVVLLEESLGAEFVGAYGDKRGLTPVLDNLAKESMLFTRAYATGTRTVRGMEAVSASFPPVPGESIVKRPHNEGMFNWSTVMAKNGYVPTFIYGGFGTFDNMNYFFGSNGYRVVDRTDMDEPHFANIWGVSDEDLFRNAVRVFDDQHGRGEKIYSIIMTTSNHKPYTFPPGVEGVPVKGGGRDAGVRYADYAIGRFFEMAKAKPWFDDTLFVIVADHGARVYGREDIPIRTYEIPLLLYSPKHIKPGPVDMLTSQIDVAPTVLGILDFNYDSTFFGIDVLRDSHPGRLIPLNHNRDIALFDGRNLIEIGFRKTSAQYVYDAVTHSQTPVAVDPERTKDAIAIFQEAFELYSERRYRIAERPD
ncbi:MAG: LTA synthase family protein [Betaproteobacteria bacterium]|nr:LTA synthase family protein [Betaproteobacteria bacterium]